MRIELVGGLGCVDMDTEFLSPRGWVKISDWENHDVAQYCVVTGKIEYVKPEYVKLPCDKLYHFKTKYGIDQMICEDHRVLYLDEGGSVKVASGKQVYEKHNSSVRGFRGKFITTFSLPEMEGEYFTDEELRVMVMVAADGHIANNVSVSVNVKKERKKIRARELLMAAGIEFKEHKSGEGYARFYFKPPVMSKKLNYWFANEHQLRVICDESFFWDGSDNRFFTCCKETADFMSYAFSATGRRVTVSEDVREDKPLCYGLTVCDVTEITMSGSPTRTPATEVVPKDGMKYCFRVPTSFWVARRNGRVFVTGNCGKTTLCKSFEKLGCVINYEDLSHNPFLAKCYEDPKKYRFPSQMWFALEKYRAMMEEDPALTYVYDQATLTNNAYTNLLYKDDFEDGSAWLNIKSTFEQTQRDLGAPDIIIDMRCDPYTQLDRIRSRGREFETVDIKFVIRLQEEIDLLLTQAKKEGKSHIYTVDVSELSLSDYDKLAREFMWQRAGEAA